MSTVCISCLQAILMSYFTSILHIAYIKLVVNKVINDYDNFM